MDEHFIVVRGNCFNVFCILYYSWLVIMIVVGLLYHWLLYGMWPIPLMAIPNFITLFALFGTVAKLTKEHFSNIPKNKKDKSFWKSITGGTKISCQITK